MAKTTAHAVRQTLVPHIAKISDVLEELNGGKALLRERLRLLHQQLGRKGRWRLRRLRP